jgi:hypothetical protein
MAGKRVSKSKSSIREEMAKASRPKVHPSHNKVYAKAREGETCRLWPHPSRHGTQLPFLSPQASASLYLPKPASRGTFPSTLKLEELTRDVLMG